MKDSDNGQLTESLSQNMEQSSTECSESTFNYDVQFPSFYDSYRNFVIHPPTHAKAKEMDKLNWITPLLQQEILSCVPKSNEINKQQDNLRSSKALSNMTLKLFPVGQIFASHV